MPYQIREIPGTEFSDTLHKLNRAVPEWPALQERHIDSGYWWLVLHGAEVVAFAGLTPMTPFPDVGYLKRCYVMPDHHGHGLQYRLMMARELKAKQLGWSMLVAECSESNIYSSSNFRKAGFERTDPEQPWAANAAYWVKSLI